LSNNKNKQFNWSRTARDVVVTAINKGQLPILGVCSVFMVILIRIPAQDLSGLLKDIFSKLAHGELIAYILLVIQSMAWFTHARIMRRNFTEETNRICKEKSELQNLLSSKEYRKRNASGAVYDAPRIAVAAGRFDEVVALAEA